MKTKEIIISQLLYSIVALFHVSTWNIIAFLCACVGASARACVCVRAIEFVRMGMRV